MQLDINRFDKHIVQNGISFCIPASACFILKYHDSGIKITQEEIFVVMVAYAKDFMPSFDAMEKYINPQLDKFDIKRQDTNSYSDWETYIKKEINDNCPIAISTKGDNGVHIRTVIGYDDLKQAYTLFNPGTLDGVRKDFDTSYTIKSSLEKYSYAKALNDYNLQDSCKDLLIIRPI